MWASPGHRQNLWTSFLAGARADLAAPHDRRILFKHDFHMDFSWIHFIFADLAAPFNRPLSKLWRGSVLWLTFMLVGESDYICVRAIWKLGTATTLFALDKRLARSATLNLTSKKTSISGVSGERKVKTRKLYGNNISSLDAPTNIVEVDAFSHIGNTPDLLILCQSIFII